MKKGTKMFQKSKKNRIPTKKQNIKNTKKQKNGKYVMSKKM